jgi:hypothetical protein
MTSPTAIRITRREGVGLGVRVGDGSRGGVAVLVGGSIGWEAVTEGVTASEGIMLSVLGGGEELTDGVAGLF